MKNEFTETNNQIRNVVIIIFFLLLIIGLVSTMLEERKQQKIEKIMDRQQERIYGSDKSKWPERAKPVN